MCGIAGILASRPQGADALRATTIKMTDAIAHRGPDGSGVWLDAERGIALGHRRLAVIDLTAAGAQPMASSDGRYILSFNGEIYNFTALRNEIDTRDPGRIWRGHSDTEVLLAVIETLGLEAALPRLDGMFAFALWDRRLNALSLARDRFGEKPLYYGWLGSDFLFGSELRSLTSHTRLGDADIDLESLELMFQTSYVPAPRSIFRGVRKLEPASWITVTPSEVAARATPPASFYWSAASAARTAMSNPFTGTELEATDRIAELLAESIRLRMVSDVPVGAMLSGGVDSTCISAIAQSLSSRRLKTFTIGFKDDAYDESDIAETVARALHTDHTTVMLGDDDALSAIAQLSKIYDEPFADSSQAATFLVCQALRGEVTVALSGDAGDELFAGYNRHYSGSRLWEKLAKVPRPLRSAAASAARSTAPFQLIDRGASLMGLKGEGVARVHKAVGVMDACSADDFFFRLTSHWPPGRHVSSFSGAVRRPLLSEQDLSKTAGLAHRMMLADTVDYLPNDVLTKVDRASMSVALEARVPFLDPGLFDFAWSLPPGILMQSHRGKLPLRRLVERYVPKDVMDRPKQGFALPLGSWLRGGLRPWADDLLSSSRLTRSGFYNTALVERTWREHRSGASDHSTRLWPILMFESWRDML